MIIMKRILLLALLSIFNLHSFSQVIVDGVNINGMKNLKVCRVIAYEKAYGEIKIDIDFGQKIYRFDGKNTIISDSAGQKKVFKHMLHVINFMEQNGWKHYDSNTKVANRNIYHYYFRKKE